MELKPCPFCGGEADMCGSVSCNYGKHTISVDFVCLGCGTKIKLKTKWEFDPIYEAVEAWNRRVSE